MALLVLVPVLVNQPTVLVLEAHSFLSIGLGGMRALSIWMDFESNTSGAKSS